MIGTKATTNIVGGLERAGPLVARPAHRTGPSRLPG